MIVCIAEKPSVAKEIADSLKAYTRRNGYYEGNGYQVTWTFGHLCGLLEPHEYNPNWKPWTLSSLPMIPSRFSIKVMEDEGIQKQFQIIKDLVRQADEVINCGDAGQEGELIQRWVLQKAGCKCPVKRLWVSSLTAEAIKEGFAQLKSQDAYQSLYEAGLMRAIGDWLLGMNATRAYTLRYAPEGQILSIGRVQTPTLALIVKRQQEIDNFVPEPYWELKTIYRDTTFSATKGRFTNEEEAITAIQQIEGSTFTITQVDTKKGTESAPRLFDLTSLQVECNKKYAFTADETLKIIQGLYEKRLTTYPRVDTTYLSDDIYPKVPNTLKQLKQIYGDLITPLEGGKLPKSKKVFDNKKVTDHHAIIPTGEIPKALTDQERKVYDLVALRFIANFYPEAKISTTTVMGEAAQTPFKATGKQILAPGWRVVFDDKTEEDNDKEEKNLPLFTVGESGPHEPSISAKHTSPPKPYTEATLLRAMETAGKLIDNEELREALKENGIGRPSTRAAIIETLFKRNYIRKERKNLYPTPTGVELIATLHTALLKSAELTGIWEKKLRDIERGNYVALDFLNELKQMVSEITLQVKSDQSGARCPLCRQGKIIRGNKSYGCSRWKEGCTYRAPF